MSTSRKATASEIQAVGTILRDKAAIELLKKINDEIVTEEDTKGKRKQNDIFEFVGFAHQDDILGEDSKSEEFQEKQGSLKRLVDYGLILEGFHIPLERKNEKKFGDVRVSDTENKIGKYRLTEEGFTILTIVDEDQQQRGAGGRNEPAAATATQVKSNNTVPNESKQKEPESVKDKLIAAFKQDVKEENKE